NLLANHHGRFAPAGEALRVALTAMFSFDTSLEELLLMAAGHELPVVDADTRLDPAALGEYVVAGRIDLPDVTPSSLAQLLRAGLLRAPRHRPRVILLGGEATGPGLWREVAGAEGTVGYNLYGPTESTVDALCCRLDESATPAVGRPLGNVRAYVL